MGVLDNGFTYFPYAIQRFGFVTGVSKWWTHYASPTAQYRKFHERLRKFLLIDRRKKGGYPNRAYAVDRDGDLYLVECPQCNDHQLLFLYRRQRDPDAPAEACPLCYCLPDNEKTHFHCYHCDLGFSVYLEDGVREIQDYRKGKPPLPTILVKEYDKAGQPYCMGIEQDAPWWWKRYEVYRDFNPKTGKDAHGHKPYQTWPSVSAPMGNMQAETAQ